MRIHGWRIDGFGVFHDMTVVDLPAGLTIVGGPNEAGKSTLLAFLRGVLFGFPDGRMRARRYEPVNGGRHGGTLLLADDDGAVWAAERYAEPRSFALRRPDGSRAEDHELAHLLGHADATLFGNVFAFGLNELDAFELLDSDAVRDRVFSAGVIGAGRSARDALTTLDARRSALLRPRGRCEIRELTEEAREAARQLARATAASGDLDRRRDDLRRLAEEADRRRAEADACREDQRRLSVLIEVWPLRSRVASIDDALAGLEVPDAVDDAFLARFEKATRELEAATRALTEAEDDLEVAIARRDDVQLDDALVELAGDIRATANELAVEADRGVRLDELDRTVIAQRELLEEQLARLGPAWDREHLSTFDASIPTAEEVRQRALRQEAAAEQIERLIAERVDLERQHDEVEATLAGLRQQLDDSGHGSAHVEVDRRAQALRQLRVQRVELGTHSSRLDATERSLVALRGLADRVGPSARVAQVLLGLAVLLGVATGGLVAADAGFGIVVGTGTAAGVAALLGAGLLVARRSAVSSGRRSALAAEIRAAEEERDAARAKVEILRSSVHAAAMFLGLPAEPTPLEIEDCAAELRSAADDARDVAETRSRVEELTTRAGQLDSRLAELNEDISRRWNHLEREREEWNRWKRQRRVPAELGTEAINDLFTAIERARTTLRSLQAAERERAALDEASSAWRERAAALLEQAGASDPDVDLPSAVAALGRRAEADEAARRTLLDRRAAVEEAEERCEVVCDRVAVAMAERDTLLGEAGVDDEAELRQVVARWRRREELRADRERTLERIYAAVGRGEAAMPLLDELERGDPAGWEAALAEAVNRLGDLEARHEEAIRAHHDAARDLEELSRSGDVPEAALRVETARARLADSVAEWQTLTAARQLIADTLGRYERERQPRVLARAEEMFAAVTDQHYRSLSVVDGDLAIIDRAGRRLSTDGLSRGSVEQLYMCVRFGLAAEMASTTPLPFVMDDVLVNFDPERTERMAQVLADLARQHQVLVFTCHPTTVEALRSASPDARVIDLPRHGTRAGAVVAGESAG